MNIFEITIQPKTEKGWPVAVKHSLPQNPPFYYKSTLNLNSEDNFAELGQYLGQPHRYGTELGKKLFTPEMRLAFAKALSITEQNSHQQKNVLSVFLHIDTFNDDSLKQLRWERLCAPFGVGDDDWEHLSTDRRTTFSIYVPTMTERLFPVIGKNDLRSLIVAANPSNGNKYGLADFDVKKTVETVQTSLHNIPSDVLAKDIEGAVGLPTLEQLKQQLSSPDKYYTLLHLVCHGKFVKGETVIYLVNDDNQVDPIKTSVLIKELKDLPRAPHFAFLSTCESAISGAEMGGLAQSLAQKLGMPGVLGMTDPVTIYSAGQLTEVFYQQLTEHGDISFALSESLVGLRRKRGDVTVPVLFSRLAGKPIYSKELDRELTHADIRVGMERLRDNNWQLLKERSPILISEFQQQEKRLGNLDIDSAAQSEFELHQRREGLKELNNLCKQVLDISFNALALTGEINDYDSRCPFRGLKAFRTEDQEFFCGREALIKMLKNKLEKYNFLAVLGASGTGKSSLVLAGLIPLLQQQYKEINLIVFTPDNNPLEQLQEKRLQFKQPSQMVIVIDQFEEVFTLCEKSNRDNFIAELLKLAQSQKVIITMRADFWGECAEYEKLKELMQKNQELISPMNAEELRKTIEEQAEKVGLRFESGVVNLIQKDVESAPGEMPLLQYALEELWQRRRGKWLLSEEYNNIGFQEAIARTADKFYRQLSEVEQEQVKNIFLRLTHLEKVIISDEKPKYTRQRIDLKDLITRDNFQIIEQLVQRLAGEEARLVVTRTAAIGNGVNQQQQITVEVAHEALITHWPKLQGWLEENRANLQLRQSIRESCLEWKKHQEDRSFLVHYGNRLATAEALLQQKGFLNENEIIYVNACIRKQTDEREKELLQARKAKRAAQLTTSISILATIIVSGLGLFAWDQKREAEEQKEKAEINLKQAKQHKADFLVSVSRSLFNQGQELDAFINTIQAGNIVQQYQETESEVMAALVEYINEGSERNRLEGHEGTVSSVSFSPDGKILASGSYDNNIKLWDAETGVVIHTLQDHYGGLSSLSFSPDGKTLASGSYDKTIKLWNVKTGAVTHTLKGHKGTVSSVSISPDGKTLASGSEDNTIKLWDVETGKEKFEKFTLKHDEPVNSVSISPDGKTLASASDDGTIKLWNTETAAVIDTLKGHDESVKGVSFSPDGKTLASASEDNTIKLWNAEDGAVTHTLEGHEGGLSSLSFSPDGKTLASGSYDNNIKLWDVETGTEIRTLYGHHENINSVSISPDGKTLASGSDDNTIKLWNVNTGTEIRTLKGHDESVYSVSFSPDGKTLASGSHDKTIKLWNAETAKVIHTLSGHDESVHSVSFSPDGKILASNSSDNTIKLWDVEKGTEILTLEGYYGKLSNLHFSPNGKTLAFIGEDNTIKLWNINTGKEILTLEGHNRPVSSVSFSPDGKILASGSQDRTIKLWDVEMGKEIRILKGHNRPVSSVSFSPDGKILASGSQDYTIKLWNWNVETAETAVENRTLQGHNQPVSSVSFSPDGKILASGSDDNTIKLWDVEKRAPIRTLKGHGENVTSVSFSPDGLTLASSSQDNTIKLWSLKTDINFDSLMRNSCDWVRNYLKSNPNVKSEENQQLCDNIPSAKD